MFLSSAPSAARAVGKSDRAIYLSFRGKLNKSNRSLIAGLLIGTYGLKKNEIGFGKLSRLLFVSGLRRQLRSMNFRTET
jgi:hypothetical protein